MYFLKGTVAKDPKIPGLVVGFIEGRDTMCIPKDIRQVSQKLFRASSAFKINADCFLINIQF